MVCLMTMVNMIGELIVAQVVVLASRCGEAGSDAVQLAVVRALLTVVTAEHFVVHGDCLMQARAAPRCLAWR